MCFEDTYSHKPDKCLTATLKTQGLNLVHVFQVRRAFFFLMWLSAFLSFLSTHGQARCEERRAPKKKKEEGRKIPSDRECVRARERDETPAAPQSGLHLSTGPQWI